MTLGSKLKRMRKEKHLSQIKLSKLSKVPQTTISNIERDICSPTINTLKALSKALKINISQLLE